MTRQIKLLLFVLGFGLGAAAANATCSECDLPEPPPTCDEEPPPDDPTDSMPNGVIIDDMSTTISADEVTQPSISPAVNSSAA
jgi:hypothetical protein